MLRLALAASRALVFALAALVTTALGATTLGCAPEAAPPAQTPPAPLPEIISVPPAPGMVWVAGCWHWDGGGYLWLPGHWESAPAADSPPAATLPATEGD